MSKKQYFFGEIRGQVTPCACVCRPAPEEKWFYAKPGSYLEDALCKLEEAHKTLDALSEDYQRLKEKFLAKCSELDKVRTALERKALGR